MNSTKFWHFVEALCRMYSCSITSSIRTEKRNEAVGGAPRSRHMLKYGYAADLVPDDPEWLDEIVDSAYRLGFDYAYISDKGHVHVQSARAQ